MSKVRFNEDTINQTTTTTVGEDQPVEKEISIKEEYQLWRKNCHLMYGFVSETGLTWPSLTIQWLPTSISSDSSSSGFKQRLLLGTNTSGSDTDYLKIAETVLPSGLVTEDDSEDRTIQGKNARLRVTKKFKNDSEVNRARYDPFNAKRVATINGNGDVHLYNIDNKEEAPIVLKQHTENGYGLSWNPSIEDYLLTASDDKTVAFWDVKNTNTPVKVYDDHKDIVNEVQWHKKNQNIFGSVSDDNTFRLYDIRDHKLKSDIARDSAINTLAFSPFSENLYALGLANSNIELFDMRNPSTTLHTIMGHSDAITCLDWSPHADSLLASGSADRRVLLWDISKIGMEQVQEDDEDGSPELFMMHAGHTAPVTDLSWNPEVKYLIGTVAEDNIVNLWKVDDGLVGEIEGWVDEEDGYEGLE
ncbi:hypothetical protein WICPIJ_007774 [Wickerhamomyces pijperi]|uniref:Histone-binding protein RBBP4-like N-terminal domain-containing protein n=1 Tax=Wickerhamomyces pijperi TaxID=599730 RepID=A0A9P8Q1X8_WICPI|nr:hypothetical protein WICPIJ_007774 [Wickerhamomyces pijperi]